MNQIFIGQKTKNNNWQVTFFISFEEADKYLQILRNDFFAKITVNLPSNINDKQLRFMMHLSRLLKQNGQIYLQNNWENEQAKKFRNLGKKLGFFECQNSQKANYLSKTKPQQTKVQSIKQNTKMAIGFKSNQVQEIDEDELMKNQNINIQKQKIQNCAEKPRACANCNCGRKENQQPLISKQKLVQAVNEGKPVSGCGKCFLGDSFRCGSCPYKGLPAFKPGDKLKLMDQGQVIIQTGQVKVQSGKVKIQL